MQSDTSIKQHISILLHDFLQTDFTDSLVIHVEPSPILLFDVGYVVTLVYRSHVDNDRGKLKTFCFLLVFKVKLLRVSYKTSYLPESWVSRESL